MDSDVLTPTFKTSIGMTSQRAALSNAASKSKFPSLESAAAAASTVVTGESVLAPLHRVNVLRSKLLDDGLPPETITRKAALLLSNAAATHSSMSSLECTVSVSRGCRIRALCKATPVPSCIRTSPFRLREGAILIGIPTRSVSFGPANLFAQLAK